MNTSRLAETDRTIDRAVWDSMEPEGQTLGRWSAMDARVITQEEIEELALAAEGGE